MGTITSLVPLVIELHFRHRFSLGAVIEALIPFPFMVALAAGVWWLLIERSQHLQYHRGVAYVTAVVIVWVVALGIVDLVRENGAYVWRADIADQLGAIVFLLTFGLFALIPFILTGGVAFVFTRRYFDEEYSIIPGR